MIRGTYLHMMLFSIFLDSDICMLQILRQCTKIAHGTCTIPVNMQARIANQILSVRRIYGFRQFKTKHLWIKYSLYPKCGKQTLIVIHGILR